jgi:hypothetical protein
MRGRGRVHGGEIVGERLGTTDRWGWRDRERERERERESGRGGKERRRQLDPTEQRERERGRECARFGADKRGPPVRHRRRAGTGAHAGWA